MKRKKLEKTLHQVGRHIVNRSDLKPEKPLTDEELLASAWEEYRNYKNGRGQ